MEAIKGTLKKLSVPLCVRGFLLNVVITTYKDSDFC